jgi:hypothetical protein
MQEKKWKNNCWNVWNSRKKYLSLQVETIRDMSNNFKKGERVFCDNFNHYGTITSISADSVGTIVNYTDDNGETHCVYDYMLSHA